MMEIYRNFAHEESSKPLVVGVFEDGESLSMVKEFEDLNKLFKEKAFDLSVSAVNKVYTFGKLKNEILYLIGLGEKSKYGYGILEASLRNVNYRLGNELIIDLESFRGNLDIHETAKRVIQTIGFYNYVYDECLTKKIHNNLTLRIRTDADVTDEIEEAFNLVAALDNTRDLVNKPYNYLSATDLADYALSLANSLEDKRVAVKIYNKTEIQEFGMNAFLGVNKGSTAEPKLIHLEYRGSDDEKIGLVGKGLMYDTGGYSIKQTMNNMKNDMAGAATVLGIFEVAVKNSLKINLQVIICATDNRINGEALLPDDVLTAMNKKTIEIVSTDAEGRLTLADAVCFAQSKGCREIIDLATLTGAIVVALGDYTTGLFGNDENSICRMIEAAKLANEELWHMPINDYIRDQVRSSKVADLKNSTGRAMGASGAAAFIEEFINGGTTWLHLDIAGTAFHTSPSYKEFYGATGACLKTVYNYLKLKEKHPSE